MLTDFGTSTLYGYQNMMYTRKFSSVNMFNLNVPHFRFAMDDFQSLVFTMWYIARVPRNRYMYIGLCKPEGKSLAGSLKKGIAAAKIKMKVDF